MRKFSFALLCFILLPSLVWSQAASKLSPRVRPFVRGDAPKIVLTHVRVIDGTGAAARADQTLLIEDGKIAATGDAASTKIPYDAKTIDLTDRTVIPGLVGMHDPHVLSLARKIASALSGTRVKLPAPVPRRRCHFHSHRSQIHVTGEAPVSLVTPMP